MKYAMSVLLFICLCFSVSALAAETSSMSHELIERPGYTLEQRNITIYNGDYFWSRRITFTESSGQLHRTNVAVSGTQGTVRYYDTALKSWETIPLSGVMPSGALLYIDTDMEHMILSPPISYRPHENNSLEDALFSGNSIAVTRSDGKFNLEMRFEWAEGTQGHIWALTSSEVLIPWNEYYERQLPSYSVKADARWTYDGFYARTPVSYQPYSKDMFWRNPASFLAGGFVYSESCRGTDGLAIAMMEVVMNNQSEDGYWPTEPLSEWLYNDYGIGAGFYDTRFNSDVTVMLLRAYDKYQDGRYLASARKQLDYFLEMARQKHYTVEKDGVIGWLVEDYWWIGNENKRTHTALNHQLQEMNALYMMYNFTNDARYLRTADLMLNGIKFTRDHWIMEDNNLEYSYYPDGRVGVDYPTLTYNDLYDMQYTLISMGRGRDPDLQKLMEHKQRWMDANGITGYYN